jgi:hypothetical protein
VESWPIWTIRGPGTALVLDNLTTGLDLSLSTTIPDDHLVTIDTTPGVKTVTGPDGANLYTDLDFDTRISALWPLRRGPNKVHIELDGATADSFVLLTWKRRYNAA